MDLANRGTIPNMGAAWGSPGSATWGGGVGVAEDRDPAEYGDTEEEEPVKYGVMVVDVAGDTCSR